MPKADALRALLLFDRHAVVSVSPHSIAALSTLDLATANPGFVDRLIHGASHSAGQTLVTFEKAAKKLPGTKVL